MGILDKVKNMFTEEVEEPIIENVKTETIEKEVVAQKKEEAEENVAPKKEEKIMPIFFDDQDFATLDKPKDEKKNVTVEEKYYTKKPDVTEKKVFKLSPVISPVYGVLDKNYHKEDITPKRSTPKVTYYDRESITIDEVRKKAYGPLENNLEDSFVPKEENNDEEIDSRVQRKYRDEIMIEDLMDPNYIPKKNVEYSEEDLDIDPVSLDDFLVHDEEELETDYKDPNEDTLTESDLFHLIDSMYDKEDE